LQPRFIQLLQSSHQICYLLSVSYKLRAFPRHQDCQKGGFKDLMAPDWMELMMELPFYLTLMGAFKSMQQVVPPRVAVIIPNWLVAVTPRSVLLR
jgi:hypothetical protein